MRQAAKVTEAVSGRATGVLFFAGFGAIWMINGLAAIDRLNPVSLAAIAAMAAALAVPAVRLLRLAAANAPHNPPASPSEIECHAEIKRAFRRVNTAQWIAIVAAIVVLNLAQKVEYLAPVITFIVGMHLFPLATLFRYPAHNVSGTLLVLWAIANTAILPPQMLPSTGALGTATILLGSAAYTICSATRAARTIANSPSLQTQSA